MGSVSLEALSTVPVPLVGLSAFFKPCARHRIAVLLSGYWATRPARFEVWLGFL